MNKGWFKKGHKLNLNKIPWNKGKKFLQVSGKKHWNWKSKKVGYHGIHTWLKKYYGKANQCQANLIGLICLGKSKKFEWAKLKGKKYERKRENYIMLCQTCHRIYDLKGKPAWNKGVPRWWKTSGEFKKGHPKPKNAFSFQKGNQFAKGNIPWNKGRKLS